MFLAFPLKQLLNTVIFRIVFRVDSLIFTPACELPMNELPVIVTPSIDEPGPACTRMPSSLWFSNRLFRMVRFVTPFAMRGLTSIP